MFTDPRMSDQLDATDMSPQAADFAYSLRAHDTTLRPSSPEAVAAYALRDRGEFIRHGAICSLDYDLYRMLLEGHETMGTLVECQGLRDQARARDLMDEHGAFPGAGSVSNRVVRDMRREDSAEVAR